MTAQDKALKENTASAPLQIVAPGTCVETGEQAALVLGMYDHLVETIHQYNPSADFAQIDKAFRYADTHHNGQLRKDGSPFITHPLAVAQIIAEELRLDSESIEAALMHDCIEDTSATYAEIAKEFSPAVADLVEGVSKLTRVQYASKEEEQMENLRKMLMAMAKDIRVILIKLADRTHNMRTMEYQTAEKQRQKSLETMEIYAPIAHRLGMQRIKWELEDLSLKYLDPVGYDEITRSLAAKEAEHEAFMERVQAQIEERLKEQHVPYLKVYGRMKHPYSIYRKMYAQNKTMDEVLDLFAFRVIVDTVADCYNVLGIIHDLYRPILGRFKDYIGTPKPNMYQSLHTTVIGADGIPFEVQIRTEEMHEIAEYGVAAHWKYKQGISGNAGEHNYEWVRRLLEIRRTPTPRNSSTRSRSTCSPTRSSSSLRARRDEPPRRRDAHRLCLLHPLGHRQPHDGCEGQRAHRPARLSAQKRRHRRNSDFEKRARPQPRLAQDRQIERGTQQNSPVVQKGAPRGKHHQRPHLV